MPIERWGSLSVKDHTNPALLVPEILLYDRLVLPIPDNDKEITRWEEKGWQPNTLFERLEALGDIAVTKPWDSNRQAQFARRMEELKAIQFDAKQIVDESKEEIGYQMTRMILAQEKIIKLPKGVHHVDVVGAYQSESDFNAEWYLNTDLDQKSHLGMLFRHQLAIPDIKDANDALGVAIDIGRDSEFKEKRRKFYDWQLKVLDIGYDPQKAVEEMQYFVDSYNRTVKKAVRKVHIKYAFTVAGIAIGIAGATLWSPVALTSAALSIVQFATFDRKPVIESGEAAPAAMFHDIESKIGLKLGQKAR